MDFSSVLVGRILRVVAIVALVLGLADAGRLLGISGTGESPISLLGPAGFAFLLAFCLARLFASVGLWIGARWGSVLIVGASLIEMGLALFGVKEVSLSLLDFALRIVMVLVIGGLFVVAWRHRRAHD